MAPSWRTISSDLVDLHGADTIAAVIVEPMAGSTGVLVPPKSAISSAYARSCDKHGIICDL
jgi:beta-alanine--pyruvate transaminase